MNFLEKFYIKVGIFRRSKNIFNPKQNKSGADWMQAGQIEVKWDRIDSSGTTIINYL